MTARVPSVPAAEVGTTQSQASMALDLTVARLLRLGTVAAVVILAIGVLLMAAAGRSPLEMPFPPFDLASIPADVLALRPEGFLWLGLVAVILTPIGRVTASLVGYVRSGDRSMVLISIAILAVIAASVVIAAALS